MRRVDKINTGQYTLPVLLCCNGLPGGKVLKSINFSIFLGFVFSVSLASAQETPPAPTPSFDGVRASDVTPVKSVGSHFVAAFESNYVSAEAFLRIMQIKTPAELAALLPRVFREEQGALFRTMGQIASFDLTPAEYAVRHAISYYIPKSYKADGTAPVLFVLHGGGGSTSRYESAKSISQAYLRDFTQWSESTGTILLAPSSSVGWSYVTRILVRNVLDLAKRQLAFDTNRVYFWGHSMGGMGLVRESHWLINEGATFMPNAAGMQNGAEGNKDNYQIDPIFLTYFDTRMIHNNGSGDHFRAFLTRTEAVKARLQALEPIWLDRSGYEYVVENRGHNYDLSSITKSLTDDVLTQARNLYQPTIYPLLGRVDTKSHRLGPDVNAFVTNRYLWIEAPNLAEELGRREFEQGSLENFVSLRAQVKNNVYSIAFEDLRLKTIRVLVSSKMVDLSKPIEVRVNNVRRFRGKIKPSAARMLEIARARNDRNAIFESYIDLKLE